MLWFNRLVDSARSDCWLCSLDSCASKATLFPGIRFRRFARCNFLSFPTYSTRRFKIQTVSRRFIARGKCNVHASVDGLDLSSSPLESPLGHLIKTVEYPCEIRKTDIRVTSLPLGFLQGERKKRGGGGEGGGIDENVDRFALQRDVGCGGRFSS